MIHILSLAAIALFCWAAVTDLRSRRIGNRLVLAVALLGLIRIAAQTGGTPLSDLAVAAGILAAGAGVFHFGVFGGGDAKLLAAGALWTGASAAGVFLIATAITGGLLAFGMLLCKARSRPGMNPTLPYGVAIAAGGIIASLGAI